MSDMHTHSDKAANDLANLSDTIRRHAEELARISGRLAHGIGQRRPKVDDFPPLENDSGSKPPVQTGTFAAFKYDNETQLPARMNDPSLSSDSLPVLTAFREFLEQERQRARKRLFRLGLLIMAATMAIIAVGLLIGHTYIARTRQHLESGQARIEAARRSADTRMSRVAEKTAVLENTLARERQDLKAVASTASNLNRKIDAEKTVMAKSQTEIMARVQAQLADMERLRDALTALEIENAMLSGNLKNMTDKVAEYEAARELKERRERLEFAVEGEDMALVVTNTPVQSPLMPFRLPEP